MDASVYAIPAERLTENARIPLRVLEDATAVFYELALDMVQGIESNNAANRDTVYIVPVGPVGQYPIFVRLVNEREVSLRRCWFINMDEYLDDNDRYIDAACALSFRGYMEREVYAAIRPELVVPPAQRLFPDPAKPETIAATVAQLGGVDAAYGGVGLNGHLAFNEPIDGMTTEDFARLPTRVVDIAPETRCTNAIAALGGAMELMPRRAVTLGMADILAARRIRLGLFRPWHRAAVRQAAHGEQTASCPASLLQRHKDALLLIGGEAAGAAV